MARSKKISKEELAGYLREDRERIKSHLKNVETMSAEAKGQSDQDGREFQLYNGTRTVKMLELLLKSNESMLRYVEKFEENDDSNLDAWKDESEVEPAFLENSVFGDS